MGIKDKKHILVAMVFAVIGMAAISLGLRQSFDYGMTADSAIYLLMASSMSPYYPAPDINLLPFLFENYPFPPLFPAVMALFGGGHEAILISYMVNAIIFLLAMWFYFIWSKSVLGSTWVALTVLVLLAMMPNTIKQLLIVQSEHLYLLLLLAGLWAWQQPYNTRYDYMAGILFALATLTRTIGILVVVVYIVRYWSSRGWRERIGTAMLVLVPIVFWSIYHQLQYPTDGYMSIFLSGMEGNLLDNLLGQIRVNIYLMGLYWVRSFDSAIATHSSYVIFLLTTFMLVGFVIRLSRLHADALFVLLYLLVLLVWPYPAQIERFFYVLTPFALVYGIYAIQRLRPVSSDKMINRYTGAYMLAMMLIILPTLSGMASRFFNDNNVNQDQVRTIEWLQSRDLQQTLDSQQFMGRIYHFMRDTAALIPQGECVLSTIPAYFMLHTGHMSIKPAHSNTDETIFEQDRGRCRYVFMLAATPKPSVGNPPMYPFHRISERMEVLAIIYMEPGNSNSHVAAMLSRI